MEYQQVLPAVFIERPNRFVALCMLEGHPVTAHVKNTGRCRELLTPGAAVFLQHQPAPGRKTQYTLTHVQKGKRLVLFKNRSRRFLLLKKRTNIRK